MNQSTTIAISIVTGFALVAAAIFFSDNNPFVFGATAFKADSTPARSGNIRHLYGSPDAPTTIVEFSDFECPFCARLHPTLKRIVDESNGDINWEYRHLPLTIHPHARLAAAIGECTGKELGNEAFWQYSDTVFSKQQKLSRVYLMDVATKLGMNETKLTACIESDKIKQQVAVDEETAFAFGGNGTPFSIIVYPDGTTKPVSGALPYENWQSILTNN